MLGWTAENAPHLAVLVHLLVVFVTGGALASWRSSGRLRQHRSAARGLTASFLVAAGQVLGYFLARYGGELGSRWASVVSLVGTVIEFAGVAFALYDVRGGVSGKGLLGNLGGWADNVFLGLFVLGGIVLVVGFVVMVGRLITYPTSERPPALLEGSTSADTYPGSDCASSTVPCDWNGFAWEIEPDERDERIVANIRRSEGLLFADDHEVEVRLFTYPKSESCPATVEWTLTEDYESPSNGTLRGQDDTVTKETDARIIRVVAVRTDNLDCTIRLRVDP